MPMPRNAKHLSDEPVDTRHAYVTVIDHRVAHRNLLNHFFVAFYLSRPRLLSVTFNSQPISRSLCGAPDDWQIHFGWLLCE